MTTENASWNDALCTILQSFSCERCSTALARKWSSPMFGVKLDLTQQNGSCSHLVLVFDQVGATFDERRFRCEGVGSCCCSFQASVTGTGDSPQFGSAGREVLGRRKV